MSIVLDKEFDQLREYEKDFDYFDDNYDELSNKYKNEFIAIKNGYIYHNKELEGLLQMLKTNKIDSSHTFIQFIRDKNIRYI
jgi:hypothetical protein